MSIDFTVYIHPEHQYSTENLRNYLQQQYYTEIQPDFSFDLKEELEYTTCKVSSRILNSEEPETYYQCGFEIMNVDAEAEAELFTEISIASKKGYTLCCYGTEDVLAALFFSDYFVSAGGVVFVVDAEMEMNHNDLNNFIESMKDIVKEDLTVLTEFEDWNN